MCLPLASQNVFSCNLNARTQVDYINQDISDSHGNTVLSICGSCNMNTSYENVVRTSASLECPAFSHTNCGPKQLACFSYQQCINNECVCSLPSYKVMSWNPFLDISGDDAATIEYYDYGTPAPGCYFDPYWLSPGATTTGTETSIVKAAYNRQSSFLQNFVSCINLNNSLGITQFTVGNFSNAQFRNIFCTALVGQCSPEYCDQLAANFTGPGRNQFCSAFLSIAGLMKGCGENFKFLNGQSQSDCASSLALNTFQGVGPSGPNFNMVDLFNFLGCDSPHVDMIYVFQSPFPTSYQFRAQTISKYLADGSFIECSKLILFLCLAVGFILF